MRYIEKTTDASAIVELSAYDMLIICNALNEVLNGLDLVEFETRMGSTERDATTLLEQFSELYKKLQL